MSTESELDEILNIVTSGTYRLDELRKDIIDKIEGRTFPESLLTKIRTISGSEPIDYPRLVPLFMRFWDSIDRELKGLK